MKTIKIKIYSFEELSEQAQQKAMEHYSDFNVDSEWWEGTYDDAENVGIKIKGFDIDRGNYIKCDADGRETARLIIEQHGADCDTYKLAAEFNKDYDKLVEKYSNGVDLQRVDEDNEYQFDQEADDLEAEFNRAIGEEYLSILKREYEYLTSAEAIKESIIANDYQFTVDGKRNYAL